MLSPSPTPRTRPPEKAVRLYCNLFRFVVSKPYQLTIDYYDMSRTKSRTVGEDPIKSAQKILALSDKDFAKWLDRVINAGLRIGR